MKASRSGSTRRRRRRGSASAGRRSMPTSAAACIRSQPHARGRRERTATRGRTSSASAGEPKLRRDPDAGGRPRAANGGCPSSSRPSHSSTVGPSTTEVTTSSRSRGRAAFQVASLIWTGAFGARFAVPTAAVVQPPLPRDASFIARAQTLLAAAAAHDPAGADLRATSVAGSGWRMLHLLTDAATAARPRRPKDDSTIDQRLARAWRTGSGGAEVIRAALILCADHELNVSSFTARCVASAGSTPYAVLIAGLSALEGFRHGGASARVESMLDGMRSAAGGRRQSDHARSLRRTIAARFRRGE